MINLLRLKFTWFFGILQFTLFFGISTSTQANTLVVTTTDDIQDISDGKCSLREAVAITNGDGFTDTSCGTVGSTNFVIQLSDATYCLGSELIIRNTVTLSGAKGGSTTLDGGNGSTTSCETASNARIASVVTDNITIELNDLIIQGGFGTTGGGGFYLNGRSTLTVNQSQFISNQVINTDTLSTNGGGIYANECEALVLKNTRVEGNLASAKSDRSFGGGVSAVSCHLITIENTTFDQNKNMTAALDKGTYGGGFFGSNNTTLTITNSTFSNNEASHTGIEASSTCDVYGGGIYIYGTANIVNTTISGNKAKGKDHSFGGGLFTKQDSTINIAHSTITSNESTSTNAYGGGIGHFPPSETEPTPQINIINTILVNNTVSGTTLSKGTNCYQKVYTRGNNLFSDTSNCVIDSSLATSTVTDYTNSNAELASLADNGGAVKTHAISSSSSAKDKGDCLDVTGNIITTDARGKTRDTPCDIGAYEYISETTQTNNDTLNDDDDNNDDDDDESTANNDNEMSAKKSSGCSLL